VKSKTWKRKKETKSCLTTSLAPMKCLSPFTFGKNSQPPPPPPLPPPPPPPPLTKCRALTLFVFWVREREIGSEGSSIPWESERRALPPSLGREREKSKAYIWLNP